MDKKNSFNIALSTIRKANGITQQKIADDLGIARGSVSHWEIGGSCHRRPRIAHLRRFLELCAADEKETELIWKLYLEDR